MATTKGYTYVTEATTLDYCSDMVDVDLATHLPVLPAILIMFLLSGLERRRFKRNVLRGRFGLVVPMEFLDGHRHRWSYTAASVAIAAPIILMFQRTFAIDVPVWAKVFMVYLQGLEIAVLYFPLFACIGTRFKMTGAICNVFYVLLMLALYIAQTVQVTCQLLASPVFKPTTLIAAVTLASLPYALAMLFLFIQSLRTAVKCLLKQQLIQDEASQRNTEDHHKTYLKVSLRKLASLSSEERGWKFWQYRSMPGFLFPTRILCIIAIVLTIIITVVVAVHVSVMPSIHSGIETIEERIQEAKCTTILDTAFVCPGYRIFVLLLRVFAVSTYLAVSISIIVSVANILLFLRSFRRSMFRLFKGDKSFIITGQQTSQKYMARNMRFMGYFIAYNLWGFFVVYNIVLILCMADGIAVEYLSRIERLGDLFVRALEISVYPLTVILLFYVQMFLAKHFLLQKRIHYSDTNPPLSVDNRKFYSVVSYYLLFINVAVGLISSLARTMASFILALFQIGRLDKNLFLSGWHERDRGYAAYVGMLHVEYTHNHPALRVFCSLLWDTVLEQRYRPVRVTSRDVHVNMGDMGVHSPSVMTSVHARSHVYVNNRNRGDSDEAFSKRRVKNRWQVAYTLVRNPSLTCLRRHHPPRPETTHVPEEEHHPSLSTRCLGLFPVVVYKLSVASPLIIIGILLGIPALTLIYFLNWDTVFLL